MIRVDLTQDQAAKLYMMAQFDIFMADDEHRYTLYIVTTPGMLWDGKEETVVSSDQFQGIQGNAAIFTQEGGKRVVWVHFEVAFLEKTEIKPDETT